MCSEVTIAPIFSVAETHQVLVEALHFGDTQQALTVLMDCSRQQLDQVLIMTDGEHQTPLLKACRAGELPVVEYLAKLDPRLLDRPDTDSERLGLPIHYAAWGGHEPVLNLLLDSFHCRIDEVDAVGNTPLLYAIFGGHLHIVKNLLARGASLREVNHKGHCAVIQAACGGHKHVVQYLLAHGASLHEKDEVGNTALLFAAWGGHLPLVQWLLKNGSDLSETSFTGHSPLLSAANSGSVEVVEWLLSLPNVSIDQCNSNGDTALLLAAFGGHIELFRWLLAHGANMDVLNNDGLDVLLSACNGGQQGMVELLLDLGLDLRTASSAGYTPVILAACGGHLELVSWLVEKHGCDLNARTNDRDTALLLACYCGHAKLVDWLIEHGSDLSARNSSGLSALISAANGGRVDVIDLLLERGVPVDDVDCDGYTALLLAARRGNLECVQRLLLAGASTAIRTKLGLDCVAVSFEHEQVRELLARTQRFSSIHYAVLFNNHSRLEELLSQGVAPTTQSKGDHQVTPLSLAMQPNSLGLHFLPRIDDTTRFIVHQATLPWVPERHFLFGPRHRAQVELTLMLANRLPTDRPDLPYLPREIWFLIASFLGRDVEIVPSRLQVTLV
eukprot:m.359516 g.359516  ORF g.359516 m.359516 type:complete len:616 (-) comp18599_c0_seq1:383-2230(-)